MGIKRRVGSYYSLITIGINEMVLRDRDAYFLAYRVENVNNYLYMEMVY